ncbi:diacylglycerol kinase family protein [Pseudoalteromonas holothuriae]|nr:MULTISPECIES: diacylglycerol kinase family protein [unclassified Pseudoalteromonas]
MNNIQIDIGTFLELVSAKYKKEEIVMKMIKYYLLLFLLSVAFVVLSYHNWFFLPALWLCISLACVLFAYSTNYPSVFRKSATGSIPVWIKCILLPYLLATQLYNAFMRHHDKVPAIQKITDDLFLACRLFPSDVDMLESKGVNAILDVTAEFDGLNWSAQQENLYYLNIPILDHFSPTQEQLEHAINWIKAQHQLNNKVVVHCALGRGRSFFMLCAYLLASKPDISVREVIEQVQEIRGTARLNKKQLKRLVKLSNQLKAHQAHNLSLIINPASGSGKWFQHDNAIIGELTKKYTLLFHFTKADTDVKKLSESLIESHEEPHTLVACGGDGTVGQVACAVKNTHHHLGIIPMGTANALAHVLWGFSSKIDPISEACDAIIQHKTVKMDTMQCNGKTALLVVALGLEEQMIDNASREQKNELGQLAYIKGFFSALVTNKALNIHLALDNQPQHEVKCSSIVVANAAPFSTVLAQGCGAPDWQDGLLDVTQLDHTDSTTEQLTTLAELFNNSVRAPDAQNKNIKHCHVKHIQINSDQDLKYSIDGEIDSATELKIHVLPASLSIIAS